jgi:hypothetical protein
MGLMWEKVIGSCCKVLSWHFPGGSDGTHRKSQSVQLAMDWDLNYISQMYASDTLLQSYIHVVWEHWIMLSQAGVYSYFVLMYLIF